MSWFDSANLANLAKSAVKEAQKTLDMALDIKDEEKNQQEIENKGLKRKNSAAASVWGSFSGSFFDSSTVGGDEKESPSEHPPTLHEEPVSSQPVTTIEAAPNKQPVFSEPVSSKSMPEPVSSKSMPEPVSSQPMSRSEPVNTNSEPVASQPKSSIHQLSSMSEHPKEQSSSSSSSSFLIPNDQICSTIDPDFHSSTSEMSSVLTGSSEGEIVLLSSPCDDKFSSSRLVVECDNPTLESPMSDDGSSPSPGDEMQSVDLYSPSSIEVISPSSVEVCSPSSIEIISPSSVELITDSPEDTDDDKEPEEKKVCVPGLVKFSDISLEESMSQDLDSSMSSDRTLMESVISEAGDVRESDLVQSDEDVSYFTNTEIRVLPPAAVTVASDCDTGLLEEAMVENEKKSGTSSSGSSEIVKIESLPPSGATSCDELDSYTATSSDIEVISSPGYSKGFTRHSSNVIRRPESSGSEESSGGVKGHQRQISDQSVPEEPEVCQQRVTELEASLDLKEGQVGDLRKKVGQLEAVITAREGRLMAVSREIAQLQEESGQMSVRLEKAIREGDRERVAGKEATSRLEAMEKKMGGVIGERDRAVVEAKKMKEAVAGRMSSKDVAEQMEEKDEIIKDLTSEGEALSRQAGKQAESIRKLRSKNNDMEAELKKVKAEAEKLKTENERLDKSLSAKNELEGSQIAAIQNLTSANQAWEAESNKHKSDLEDSTEKVLGLRTSLESAYREMAEMKRKLEDAAGEAVAEALSKEVSAKTEAIEQLGQAKRMFDTERNELLGRFEEMRADLGSAERTANRREDQLMREVADLSARLEASESRHGDLGECVATATRPLLRQIETLQAGLREQTIAGERVEMSLTERLNQVSTSLAAAQERERSTGEQYRVAAGRLSAQEGSVETMRRKVAEAETEKEVEAGRFKALEAARNKEASVAEALKASFADEIAELKREKEFLEVSLEGEKLETENNKKKSIALMEQLKERDRRVRELQAEMDLRYSQNRSTPRNDRSTPRPDSIRSSPTPSLSQLSHIASTGSLSDFSRDPWPEDVFTGPSYSSSLYESARLGNTTALVESLTSQLKLKEGEVAQLQMEAGNLERVREGMGGELTKLATRAEAADMLEGRLRQMEGEFEEMKGKYQTMLTMYGEKMEEAEELRLDLQDVKEVYKTQIDQLLKQHSNQE